MVAAVGTRSQMATPEYISVLLETLSAVERPGEFACGGHLEPFLPGLEVDGLGKVLLPLGSEQAEKLKRLCARAPFGRQEQTLVDPRVRGTWQLEPARFRLTNPKWNDDCLPKLLERAKTELGCESSRVSAQLYKLLLYETGQHFVAHRDTEKVDGMFATLMVVMLPSCYEGGALLVRHQGSEKRFDFASANEFNICFAAFYADCRHEIQPVTRGYRLCLVYNMVYEGHGLAPAAVDNSRTQARLVDAVRAWASDPEAPAKRAFMLEHRYTPAGLSFRGLKNGDRAVAQLLRQAQEEAQLELYLAIVTRTESGGAEGDSYSGYDLADVDEENVEVDNWIDARDDRAADLPAMPLDDEEEILQPDAFEGLEPDDESVEEATGNEGATIERQYRRAALLFWPRQHRFRMLCQGGLDTAIQRWQGQAGERHALSEAIVTEAARPTGGALNATQAATLIPLLAGEQALLLRFLSTSAHRYCESAPFRTALADTLAELDWAVTADQLQKLFEKLPAPSAIELLGQLMSQPAFRTEKALDFWRQQVAGPLVDRFLAQQQHQWRSESLSTQLSGLFTVLYDLSASQPLDRLATSVLHAPEKYDVDAVVLSAVRKLDPRVRGCHAFQQLAGTVQHALHARTRTPIAEPADWVLMVPSSLSCHCSDCHQFRQFLHHPTQTQWQLRAPLNRRRHIEDWVRRGQLDITCSTVATGSPHMLVCTKNRRSLEAKKAKLRSDLKALQEVEQLLASGIKREGTSAESGHENKRRK